MLKASIAASLLVAVLASPGRQTPSHAVSALRAYLYHQETGAVDTTNLMAEDRRAPPLWNTIIGEGTAGSPSAATLVLVQLSGSFLAGTSGSVRVVAQEETRILLRRTVALSPFFSEGRSIWIPFIVYNTGCGKVTVTASSMNAAGKVESTLSKAIDFECGE